MQPQTLIMSVSFRVVSSKYLVRKRKYSHIHPPPPLQSFHSIQPGKDSRHQEPREQWSNLGKYLNQGIASSQLVGFVIARAHIHDSREVPGLEQTNTRGVLLDGETRTEC